VPYPSVDTLSSLIDEVITSLQGFGTANDQVVTLTGTLAANATEFLVDDTDNVSRGIAEIDDEIIYIASAENGTVTVPPWGRGFKGTIAATHTLGSPVWISPSWPRATVAREVNNTIKSLYPSLFGIGTVEFTSSNSNWSYALPANCERVLAVEWRYNFPDAWQTVKSWEALHSANTDDFASGKALLIGEPLPSNAHIHVVYAKLPTALATGATVFTDSGLPASARDVVVLGTAVRLIPWQDVARLPVETVPSDALDTGQRIGLATQVAGSLRTQYQARLDQERRSLLERYPTRSHKVR
jgi:hypothetical protein